MPFLVKIYMGLFILLFISNVFFYLKYKLKLYFFIYEILSAIYMFFIMLAYWNPVLAEKINTITILPLLIILGIDIYFSIWGSIEDLGLKIPDISKKEQETAKVVSIVITSPSYIMGLLLFFQIIGTWR